MNLEKLTHKSQEAPQEAQSSALRRLHSEVSEGHLMLVLLDQDGGVLPRTLQRMTVNIPEIRADLEGTLSKLPRVSGSGSELRMTRSLLTVLRGRKQKLKASKMTTSASNISCWPQSTLKTRGRAACSFSMECREIAF